MNAFNVQAKAFISETLQQDVSHFHISAVSGGSINQCYKLQSGRQQFFLKLHPANQHKGILAAEKTGLSFLKKYGLILTPNIIGFCETAQEQILLMEWIDKTKPEKVFWKIFGEQLAALHLASHDHFGFIEDNYMGALLQTNRPATTWVEFFIEQRLKPQVQLAINGNRLPANDADCFEKLYEKAGYLFEAEKPSLLHGDLWSGNFLCNHQHQPVLIDPAIYFGHRSMDLAMTTLFGGFDNLFYESYHYHFPLPHNFKEQWNICNLYPLLVHLNLYGSSYLPQISSILKIYCQAA